ncbi:Fe-S protein assembly chaperone HscA [Chitinophaga japonensis]|uniref:Molecular chaperone HscA n=1 Tax=Chitinophaga japonensis TaxID=104662 RepID=A0A562T441_CHIJA|nr:Fe-S protein assembly chaperone HscA [Chitinophaga japonensis]TWI88004.1 molecular chaperone HscA [Chitinophaga japonensis]
MEEKEMVVGIDLGTTSSLVAVMHPVLRQPLILREYNRSALLPSVVHFSDDHRVIVGDGARERLASHPRQTVYSIKRLMGRSYDDVKEQAGFFSYRIADDDPESLVKIQAGDRSYSPVELSAYILKELKDRASQLLKAPVRKAVITVPAYFNDAQRQATRDAGKLAGLDVLRIINEPTAASLAYGLGLHPGEEKTIAVYDLGGGTFDISILKISDGVFEVLSTNGDTCLGGDDLDYAIVMHWASLHEISPEALGSNKGLAQELRLKAEAAKKQLSDGDYYDDRLDNYELQLTREQLEELVQPLVEKTLQCCKNALTDAGLTMEEIDAVIMVGGATRVPLVKSRVSAFFGKPVNDSLHPDEVVALGAAVQADILAGHNKDLLLLDVTPLSLGMETMGGLMDVLIPRNTRIPATIARSYTTQQDGQTSMKIAVYQGERDLVKDNRKLAEFNLAGIPAMAAGQAKVQVSFLLNADGILVVKAGELHSGTEQSIEVKPQYGLLEGVVEEMVLDAISHAGEDTRERLLVETQTEAQQLLDVTAVFLERNPELLSAAEQDATRQAMAALQDATGTGNRDLIRDKITALNELSRPYAERLMDKALKAGMERKEL